MEIFNLCHHVVLLLLKYSTKIKQHGINNACFYRKQRHKENISPYYLTYVIFPYNYFLDQAGSNRVKAMVKTIFLHTHEN